MRLNPTCKDCGIELNDENWAPSRQKRNYRICKRCEYKKIVQWRKANPEKWKATWTRQNRKRGRRPFNENRECPSFLGVYIAEEVLGQVFKNVRRMPINNPGFDFKCSNGYLIDVKSSCRHHYPHQADNWRFALDHNTIADYFLCLAFDNRESLNPEYLWLLPGYKFNHLTGTSISSSTIHKWDEYQLDINKVSACCNTMRED